MKHLVVRITLLAALTAGLTLAGTPLQAQTTASLAKKCREMMVKANPTQVFGKTGTAEKQRAYFKECVARRGDMPDAAQASSPAGASPTGQGK